jgi:hypothetical protein
MVDRWAQDHTAATSGRDPGRKFRTRDLNPLDVDWLFAVDGFEAGAHPNGYGVRAVGKRLGRHRRARTVPLRHADGLHVRVLQHPVLVSRNWVLIGNVPFALV